MMSREDALCLGRRLQPVHLFNGLCDLRHHSSLCTGQIISNIASSRPVSSLTRWNDRYGILYIDGDPL